MALIKCPECKNQISDTTKTCIHCGFPLEKLTLVNDETTNKTEKKHNIKYTNKDYLLYGIVFIFTVVILVSLVLLVKKIVYNI